MIGSLVKYRSTRPSSRAGQLGILVALDPYDCEVEVWGKGRSATVRWLEDGATLVYLVRELEFVQTS
mgnify:CR=1 FL=1